MTESEARASGPLEGEDLKTTRREDARHGMSIYADLIEFKRGILARVERALANLAPPARKAAAEDLAIIEAQMLGYQKRLDLWYARLWELQGLWLDPDGRILRHQGREVVLTKRESSSWSSCSVIHRFFTTAQILGQAWATKPFSPRRCATTCGGCERSSPSSRSRPTWSTNPAVGTH